MNLKVIMRYVGSALLVSALFMFLSILVSIGNGNDSALAALMISFIMTFTVGIFPFIFVRQTPKVTLHEGYMIIVLSWLLSFLFGMMPYVLWGGPFSVVNAWFESVSGYTTTGSSILDDIEALPKSLLFWRSSTHFIGGLGIAVFLLLVMPSSSPIKLRLANMELSSLSKHDYHSRANKTVYIFTYVYLGIFATTCILYLIGGMPFFDSVTNAFSVCATGGFSPRNLSIGAYHSVFINVVTTVMMIVASCHYAIIFFAFAQRSLKPLKNPTLKFYLSTILVITIIATIDLRVNDHEPTWGLALMNGAFHVASYVSTTGLAIADNINWSGPMCFVLLYMSLQCGMAGSTTGGLKVDRVLLIGKAIDKNIRKALHPSTVSEIRIGTRVIKDEEVMPHLLYFALYTAILLVSVFLCHIFGNGHNSLPASIASLGNVGLSFNEIGSSGSYNWMNAPTKILMTLDMLLGRLEIYPVIAFISMCFSKKNRL